MADSNQNYKIVFDAVLNKSSIQRQFDEIGSSPSVKKSAQSIGDIFSKVLKFNLATQAINEFKEALRDSVDAVKELDVAVTEYRKVSDLTGKALDDFIDKATELGEAVARTGAQVVSAANEFKKSGFTDAESLQLAKVATMFQNVADEEISAGEAASFVISQLKAFNIVANDSQRVIDVTNEVANRFAVGTGDLEKGLVSSGSALATYNNTFEQTTALVTAGSEIMTGKSAQVKI